LLGTTVAVFKCSIWSYTKGICPSLTGLFIDKFVLQKQLKDALHLDSSNNHIIIDPNDTIICISLVSKAVTSLKKKFVQKLYNIRDHIHKMPKRYSIARAVTQPMLCHGVRSAPSPVQPFGPYEQPSTHQPEHSNLIEKFVKSVWNLVQKYCPNIFKDVGDLPSGSLYPETQVSKCIMTWNASLAQHTDSREYSYTIGFFFSFNKFEKEFRPFYTFTTQHNTAFQPKWACNNLECKKCGTWFNFT